MKPEFIRAAATKAADDWMRASLAELEAVAVRYQRCEREFTEKIKSSNANQGAAPTRLGIAQRDRLVELQYAQLELDSSLVSHLARLPAARDVVCTLHAGIGASLELERNRVSGQHPIERQPGEDRWVHLEALVSCFATFLAAYPDPA